VPGVSSFFRLLAAFVFAVLAVPLLAQTYFPIEGYISAVHPPGDFEVNGRRFDVTSNTDFGFIGQDTASIASPLRHALRVGVYVQVAGSEPGALQPIRATVVMVRDDANQKLTGAGVITRIVSTDPAIFEADGYLVRIVPSTDVEFLGGVGSFADVSTNTWLHFSGKWGKDGAVNAAKAQFIAPKPTQFKAVKGLEIVPVKTRVAGANSNSTASGAIVAPEMKADGADLEQDEQIKIGLGRWHTLPADQPLQQRVHRIGMALVPAYQRAMADDDPSKIHFRFFAVDDKGLRGANCLLDGAILVSTQTAERLSKDDQLAAVIADGIACNLQRQSARRVMDMRKELGIAIAVDVAGAFVPGVGLAAWGARGASSNDEDVMQEERLRVALALMSDASFDPWQAPEAWRLAEPKKVPANPASLPYPETSCYQLGILNLQYAAAAKASAGMASAPTAKP
jgi:hypothetical protein